MKRCWCHAAMASWLGVPACAAQAAQAAVQRWQHECERAGGDCGARVEAIALRLSSARAVRRGPRLQIFTAAGEVEFVDAERGDVHHYLGLMEPAHVHLVVQRCAGLLRFLTVCHRSGRMAAFEGLQSALLGGTPQSAGPHTVFS